MINVFLVDDHELVRTGIRRILEDVRGIKVVGEAQSGETAVTFCRQHHPDVILMDMNMPGMDGIQCLRQVKERWPLTEVIILTGHASVQSGIEGMQGGAFDYCLKPIDVRELLEKVELAAQKALINQEDAGAA